MPENMWLRIFGVLSKLPHTLKKVLGRRLIFAITGGGIGVMSIAIGAYALIDYTESSAFCGTVCHQPMYPEYTAYQASPHSTVRCTSCHVGPGTTALIVSKAKGATQIFSAISHSYPRPITSPVEDLRPARETCEECHSPAKFSGEVVRSKASYKQDEVNTRQMTTVVLNVGGGEGGVSGGIHWHITSPVWYVPLDDERLRIGWVGVEKEGKTEEFVNPDASSLLTPEYIQENKRLMDCVDCHNRATHIFSSPEELIDKALLEGSIDSALPFIKRESMTALGEVNSSLDEAGVKIKAVGNFYSSYYPQIYAEKKDSITASLNKLSEIAKLTTFPDMNVDWNTHADHSGHNKPPDEALADLNINFVDWTDNKSEGCFRCHGKLIPYAEVDTTPADFISQSQTLPTGELQTEVLDASCNLCHYSPSSKPGSPLPKPVPHPLDGLQDCTLCHGASALKPFPEDHPWSTNEACTACHSVDGDVKEIVVARPEDAKDIPHSLEGLEDCLLCHSVTAPVPIKTDHPWSTNDTCEACHNSTSDILAQPGPSPVPGTVPSLPHSLDGLEDCLLCHSETAPVPVKTDHPWSTNDTCRTCHNTSEEIAPLPVSTPKPAPLISHPVVGLGDCRSCHSTIVPFAGDHVSFPNDFCGLCHQVGASLIPPAIPIAAVSIPHSLTGLSNCLQCHDSSGVRPFPGDHSGRTNEMCTVCHAPGPIPTPTPAPSPSTTPVPGIGPTPTPAAFDTAQYFSANCSACHSLSFFSSRSQIQITTSLTAGTMAQFADGLDSNQISQLANYVKNPPNEPTPNATPNPTNVSNGTPTATPTPTPTPSPSPTATATPTPTPKPTPTATPTPTPTPSPSPTTTPTPTPTPSTPAFNPAGFYTANCSSCHPLSFFNSKSTSRITNSLTSGSMSGYAGGLNSTQISQLANYLKNPAP